MSFLAVYWLKESFLSKVEGMDYGASCKLSTYVLGFFISLCKHTFSKNCLNGYIVLMEYMYLTNYDVLTVHWLIFFLSKDTGMRVFDF